MTAALTYQLHQKELIEAVVLEKVDILVVEVAMRLKIIYLVLSRKLEMRGLDRR